MPAARAAARPPSAKLRAPRLGLSVARERLFAQLDAQRAPGLWIAGPPGMGKTTLVATYLQARAVPCLWLQLDAADADPATFVHFLQAAAAPLLPGRRLRLPPPGADDLRDAPAYLRRCVRRLAALLELPWALVLDSAQLLGPGSAVHAGLAAALAELPERSRLIAISREPPPPAWAQALAAQQLALVDERALRFDDDDTNRLLALHGRCWPAGALCQATDGWAAAMVLLLATRSELGPQEALRSGSARTRLFDFFAAEVLAGMAAADAAALLRIAQLPSTRVAMAVAVSGHAGAGALLASLARRSLFTDCRDGNPPVYSFHALFGEFLRARAAELLPAPTLQALRVHAARLLATQGDADAAMALLTDAGAWDQAFALATAQAPQLVAQGRWALLRGWLLALPEGVRHTADGAYWLGCCELASAPDQARAHLLLALAAIAGRDAALARSQLAQATAHLEAGQAIDASTHDFQRGLLMLLDANWTGAAQLMRSAVHSGRASGWPLREHIALLGQVLAATQCGRFDEAERLLQAVRGHRFHAVCVWHHWLADLAEAHLARCQADLARAGVALRRAFEVGRDGGFDFGPMPFCCGDIMPRLAALALDQQIDPPFALHLIRRHALPAPPGAGPRWPWPIRIRTLGGLAIERDGAPAPAGRKQSRKPLDLLKLLLATGAGAAGGSSAGAAGTPVPVDALCAALWPDAPGDAARNAFDNTLHRLRKLLGHERHLLLQAGGLSLDAASCWTDVQALQACLTEADTPAGATDLPALLALAEQAMTLYGGPFLAGEDELPAVQAARARIDARFTRVLGTVGARLEAAGQAERAAQLYARVLELQPLAEHSCRQLMHCLIGLGRRAEAFDAFRRCRQQLLLLLGLRPSPPTQALADTIRDL